MEKTKSKTKTHKEKIFLTIHDPNTRETINQYLNLPNAYLTNSEKSEKYALIPGITRSLSNNVLLL